ncbi:MAG: hypothetical protein ACRD24_15055, partial [Terriglobales bacterium]
MPQLPDHAAPRPRLLLLVTSAVARQNGGQRPGRLPGPLASKAKGFSAGPQGVHADTNDEARKCLEYVTRNQHRMRYPEFRA